MITAFKVPGVSCGSCASAITNAIKGQYPDTKVDVDIENKKVTINSSVAKEKIRDLIESVGYPVVSEV